MKESPGSREVWAAQPVVETPYKAPNRLIWRIADILASHKGAQSWTQAVVRTRDFAGDYVSMAPGEKTKSSSIPMTAFSGGFRAARCWCISKASRISPPPRGFWWMSRRAWPFSIENTGTTPVVFFRVTPAGEMPSYPIDETPTPVKGWKFIRSTISETGTYDDVNKPYLDFNKDVVAANGKSSNFIYDGHTSAHVIRGPGVETPPPDQFGHFHENMVEFWCVIEGKLDVLVSGEKLVTGDVGDIILAPEERWHRATSHPGSPSTRLAITPRLKEGQVHYLQAGSTGN